MTVKIQDSFKVSTKRTKHPNDAKYPGKPSFEFGTAIRKFLCELNKQEKMELLDGAYVFEEDISASFFDSIQEGDIVGLGLFSGINEKKEPSAHKFKILKVNKEKDTLDARDITWENPKYDYKGQEVELTFEEVSCALGMGFGEILERDGKPFGVSEEIEYTVNVMGEDTNSTEESPNEKNISNVESDNNVVPTASENNLV